MADATKALPFELTLTRNGDGVECKFRFDHKDDMTGPCSNITITAGSIKLTLDHSDYKSYLTGTLTGDRASMTGTFTTEGGQGKWSLKRTSK